MCEIKYSALTAYQHGHYRPNMTAMPPKAGRRGRSSQTFSIRLTAEMTGIAEETLRIWERRYPWPRPARSSGGARLYTAQDIARLRRVRRALDRGFRPGALLGRSDEEIEALLVEASATPAEPASVAPDSAPTLQAILLAVAEEDGPRLQALLRSAVVLLGARRFVVDVAHPASVRVGELWASGELEVRHEHLLSAALAGQLKVATAAFELSASAPAVLLTTLPGGTHALGLDMVAAYLASRGVSPRMLGAQTPPDQIVAAARAHRVRAIGLSVTPPHEVATTRAQIAAIGRALTRTNHADVPAIWIGGAGAVEVASASRLVRHVADWATLDTLLTPLVGPFR